MATSIAEPNDLPAGTITPQNEERYSILVYEKRQDNAGIKQLALGEWRTYLGYNSHKVNNIADFIGVDSGYAWDSDVDVPYDGIKISARINAIADKVGVSTTPASVDPGTSHKDRLDALDGYVKDGWENSGTHVNGLLARATALENSVSDINTEVGDTSTLPSGSSDIVDAINTNASDINDINSTIGDASGLSGTIMDEIGTIEGDITDINTAIGADDTSGLRLRIKTNEDDITAINTALGDTSLIPSGSDLVTEVNTNKTDIAELKQTVSSAYVVQGDVIGADENGITLSDTSTKTWAQLENGWVYNVAPAGGADTLTIKGKTYNTGANIAWIVSQENFDELGTTINVQDITDLRTDLTALTGRVDILEGKFVTSNTTWTSTGLTGFYLINVVNPIPATGTKTASCLFYFVSGQKVTSVDLTNNYADFFIDSLNDVIINTSSVVSTATVYQIKLC